MDELVKKAKEILEENLYMTLATASKNGSPWVSPVYSCHDEYYNFYYASAVESVHQRNLSQNNSVIGVLFNSTVVRGQGEGLYFEGIIEELQNETEVFKAYKYFYGRNDAKPSKPTEYLAPNPRRIYKIKVKRFWINEWKQIDGKFRDIRVEVSLLEK